MQGYYRALWYWEVCVRTVCVSTGKFVLANLIQGCSLNQLITFKVVVKCACLLFFFWCPIAATRRGWPQNVYVSFVSTFIQIFLSFITWPFFLSRKLYFLWLIGNETLRRKIQSVIILMINKLDSCCASSNFVITFMITDWIKLLSLSMCLLISYVSRYLYTLISEF